MTISTVAVCCDDLSLTADARRLCGAAGREAEVVGIGDARRWWAAATHVLLDVPVAAELAGRGFPRRGRLAVLARGDEPAGWRAAVLLGAEQVAVIPGDEHALLAGVLSARAGGVGPRVVACLPATGGAGASTVAAGLAAAAARAGTPTLLVDADPAGGGLDMLVGAEHLEGLRWPDVHRLGGDLAPESVLESLVQPLPGLRLLSFGREPDDGDSSHSVGALVAAAASVGSRLGLVVVDLPRGPAGAVHSADVLLLVVRADVRSAVAAAGVAARLQTGCRDVRLVVRQAARRSLGADDLAAASSLPVALELPHDRRVSSAADDGELLRCLSRQPFADLASALASAPTARAA
ncbi:MAG TPA: septum site-determining protein Ssd [Mycobacteriales bacterium]|nr:septum site-determining protein Ssd [Mycobacteriales bacterium]